MTGIIRMSRFGRGYTVALECGHKFQASLEETKKDQLFIGKRVACKECQDRAGREAGRALEAAYPWGYHSEEDEA